MYLKIICQTPMRIKCFNFKHFFLQSSSPPQGKVRKKRIIASWRKQKFLIRVVGEKFFSKHIAYKQIKKNNGYIRKPIFHSKYENLLHRVCHCSSHVYSYFLSYCNIWFCSLTRDLKDQLPWNKNPRLLKNYFVSLANFSDNFVSHVFVLLVYLY